LNNHETSRKKNRGRGGGKTPLGYGGEEVGGRKRKSEGAGGQPIWKHDGNKKGSEMDVIGAKHGCGGEGKKKTLEKKKKRFGTKKTEGRRKEKGGKLPGDIGCPPDMKKGGRGRKD